MNKRSSGGHMKKILLSLIGLVCLGFTACNSGIVKSRTDFEKLTYKTINYNGGFTSIYEIDFVNNTFSYSDNYGSLEGAFSEPEVRRVFTDDEERDFINGVNEAGLLGIKSLYKQTGIIDGGGWDLDISFSDGTTFSSKGENDSPESVFKKIAPYFYDLCETEIFMLPEYYKMGPHIDNVFEWKTEDCLNSSNANYRENAGNYKWNKKSCEDTNYYEINKESYKMNDLQSGMDYQVQFWTSNYSYSKRFKNFKLTQYDFDANLSNPITLIDQGWFKQVKADLTLNKIYVYRTTYVDGNYMEFAFNTKLSSDTID